MYGFNDVVVVILNGLYIASTDLQGEVAITLASMF